MGYRYNEDTGQFIGTGDEEGGIYERRDEEGGGFVNMASDEYARQQYQEPSYFSYEDAIQNYKDRKVPWNYDSVFGDSGYGSTESQGGLSNRQPFNLNAIWGGTQFAQGRVTDFSHIDPSQLQANQIAGQTRDELWNEYESLAAQGKAPAKNPDEVALDFYVKNIGSSGNELGYGPGANTALISEAIKHQFLNSPEVSQARGSTYQTPQEKMAQIDEFGNAHQAGVPTWREFEKQQYGSGFSIGNLIPAIIGGMALGPLAGALAPTFGAIAPALAGGLMGGITSEIGGGNFGKGFLTGGIGGGLTGGLSGASTALQEAGISKAIADAAVSAGSKAIMAGATGGDVEQAILGSLVGSGVGGAIGETGIDPSLAKIITPVVTTALLGGDVESALIKSGLSALKDSSWGVNEQPSQDIGDMIGSETPFDLDDAEIGVGVDLTGGTGMPIEVPGFSGGLSAGAYESYDPLPLGYDTREQVAADNVDLYPGGVLPESGYMTVYNPDGTVEYVPQTPVNVATTTGTTSGGAGATSGGIGATAGTTAGAANVAEPGSIPGYQPKEDIKQPVALSPLGYLPASYLSTGKYEQPNVVDYSQIIPKLASILGQRGYKTGGSVSDGSEYVSGPEGKLYEKHYERGFAVGGPGTGQSDDIPTMLSDGEFVIPADVVSHLGDGSSKAGAEALYKMMEEIRKRDRSTPADKLPPKAKSPLEYMRLARKKLEK